MARGRSTKSEQPVWSNRPRPASSSPLGGVARRLSREGQLTGAASDQEVCLPQHRMPIRARRLRGGGLLAAPKLTDLYREPSASTYESAVWGLGFWVGHGQLSGRGQLTGVAPPTAWEDQEVNPRCRAKRAQLETIKDLYLRILVYLVIYDSNLVIYDSKLVVYDSKAGGHAASTRGFSGAACERRGV